MQMIKLVSLALTCFLFSGCSVLDSPKVEKRGERAAVTTPLPPEPAVNSHTVCDTQYQEGCLEIVVGNYLDDPAHPVMRRLKPRISENDLVERRWRLQAGPTLWQEYNRKAVRAASGRSFVVCAYALHEPAHRSMSAWQFDGTSKPRRWDVADISHETWRCPIVNGRGVERIYRIVAFGNDPRAASFQLPWTMISASTHILVCADENAIYPNPLPVFDRMGRPVMGENGQPMFKSGGLWLNPEQLQWLRDERKSKRVHLAVVSRF